LALIHAFGYFVSKFASRYGLKSTVTSVSLGGLACFV